MLEIDLTSNFSLTDLHKTELHTIETTMSMVYGPVKLHYAGDNTNMLLIFPVALGNYYVPEIEFRVYRDKTLIYLRSKYGGRSYMADSSEELEAVALAFIGADYEGEWVTTEQLLKEDERCQILQLMNPRT